MKFSVLLSVYKNETAANFREAIDSILGQSLMPNEIVLIRDGEIGKDLELVIANYINQYGDLFSYYKFEENRGLGNALNFGVEKAKNELIVRMDTDDIALPERFKLQVDYMIAHPEVSVLGGQQREFIGERENVVGIRNVPLEHDEIVKFMRKRNAFNHPTVIFRRKDVLDSGNYIEKKYVEDYYLWLRMLVKGKRFANLDETLLLSRTGEDLYKRRGGYKYFQNLKFIEQYKYHNYLTNWVQYAVMVIIRFMAHVIVPNTVRGILFRMLRKKTTE